MIQIYVIAEGHTDRNFIKNVVAEYFAPQEIYVFAPMIGKPGHKGGNISYGRLKKDIQEFLYSKQNAYCTTFFDFFGRGKNFPRDLKDHNISNRKQVEILEEAMREDILQSFTDIRADIRFIPYIQLHEFEGLLFSDPDKLAYSIGKPDLAQKFQNIRLEYPSPKTPEDINDGPHTAPSKRILSHYPQYDKVLDGIQIAKAIGLEAIRRECPRFNAWITRLSNLKPLV